MSFRIQNDLKHLERSLGIETVSENNESPSLLVDTIQTTVEAHAWPSRDRMGTIDLTSAANVQSLVSSPVPVDQSFWVYAAHCFHSDAGANHILRIDIQHEPSTPLTIGLTTALSVSQFQAMASPRPFLLVTGQQLRVSSVDLVGLGNTLGLQALFVRLKPGEYIPWSPYG